VEKREKFVSQPDPTRPDPWVDPTRVKLCFGIFYHFMYLFQF